MTRSEDSLRQTARRWPGTVLFISIWLLTLHVIGLFIFGRGFLLSRAILDDKSQCCSPAPPGVGGDVSNVAPLRSSCDYTVGIKSNSVNGCWHPRRYDKLVFILIDALRYDFVLPTSPDAYKHPVTHGIEYRDRLPTVAKLLREQPENTLLLKSIADPPTTTLQRLKAITTGTLPTFAEALLNFGGGDGITEDNLLEMWASDQFSSNDVSQHKRRVTFMGDDTWIGLFPKHLNVSNGRTFPFDSFLVHDLDTVDNGIRKHLPSALRGKADDGHAVEGTQSDVIIAHFLGVDHCGHRYGPKHEEMTRKLTEMDKVIKDVTETIDESTLVVVMGDHGMDTKGDHGGDGKEEITAAMLFYSKGGIGYQSDSSMSNVKVDVRLSDILVRADESKTDNDDNIEQPFKGFTDGLFGTKRLEQATEQSSKFRTVRQVDIVPTLALLLGTPIPFNNLGMVIPELFGTPIDGSGHESAVDGLGLVAALAANAEQVMHYSRVYSERYPSMWLSESDQAKIEGFFEQAQAADTELMTMLKALSSTDNSAQQQQQQQKLREQIIATAARYIVFMRATLGKCVNAWAQFDEFRIGLGVAVLIASVLCNAILLVRFGSDSASFTPPSGIAVVSGALVGAVLGLLSVVLPFGFWGSTSTLAITEGSLAGGALGSAFGFIITSTLSGKSAALLPWLKSIGRFAAHWPSGAAAIGLTILLLILHAVSSSSNSFIMWEERIVLYFSQTLLVVLALIMVSTWPSGSALRWQVVAKIGIALVLNRLASYSTVCREEQEPYCQPTYYRSHDTTVPATWTVIAFGALALIKPQLLRSILSAPRQRSVWIEYGLTAVLCCAAGYWAIETNLLGKGSGDDSVNKLAKFALIRAGYAIAAVFALIKHFRYPEAVNSESRGHFVLEVSAIVLSLAVLTQQPFGAMMLCAFLVAIALVVDAVADYRDSLESSQQQQQQQKQQQQQYQSKSHIFTAVLMTAFAFMSHLYFFATGHQTTLSSIQWNAAAADASSLFGMIISGLLIALNTFGPYILAALSAPLLVTFWRQRHATSSNDLWMQVISASLMYTLCHATVTAGATAFAGVHRRHLMVWKLFAPRFMFAAPTLILVDITALLCAAYFVTKRLLSQSLKPHQE